MRGRLTTVRIAETLVPVQVIASAHAYAARTRDHRTTGFGPAAAIGADETEALVNLAELLTLLTGENRAP